jgi:hypothetical protein
MVLNLTSFVKIGLEGNIKFELKSFPNWSPYVFEQKKLEANLKGLPRGLQKSNQKDKEVGSLCSIRQPKKKNQK